MLGMLYLSPGFTMISSTYSIQPEAIEVAANLELGTNFNAVSEKLFESNVVHSITIQKETISDKKWSLEPYKYSGIYFFRTAFIYFKVSRFIRPGLNQTTIIFPFHDFI